MQDAPNWGIEPVPDRLRVLGLLDTFLLWMNLGISLLVLVAACVLRALAEAGAARDARRRRSIGNAMLAVAGLIGADARVPSMVLQRAPLGRRGSYLATGLNVLQCLGWAIFELIVIATAAARALRPRVRLPRDVAVEAGLRRRSRPCSRCSARSGSCAGSCARSGSGSSPPRSSTSRTGSSRTATSDAVGPGRPGRLVLARGRPRDRALRLVDPARRRLHALLDARRRAAFWGVGLGYLLPTLFQFGFGAILVLSHPSIDGPDRGADDRGRGRDRQLARAARADRGRDRRGVRERLLGRGLEPERAPARAAAAARRRRRGDRDRGRARLRPARTTSSSCSCSARSSCRSSACCSPTGSLNGHALRRATTSSAARPSGRG